MVHKAIYVLKYLGSFFAKCAEIQEPKMNVLEDRVACDIKRWSFCSIFFVLSCPFISASHGTKMSIVFCLRAHSRNPLNIQTDIISNLFNKGTVLTLPCII